MSVPLPGISDFLKDTLTDNVKGLLQPTNWLTATILLILNTLFIIPVLAAQNISIATTLVSLNPTLQFALAVAMVLVLAYLLLSMSRSIIKLMTGDLWYKSPFLGLRLQKSKQISPAQQGIPLNEKDEYMGSTQLGNEMRKVAERLAVFGINRASLLPYLENAIATEPELTQIHNEKATLDFLVNLTFVLVLFAIEQVLVQFFWPQGWAVLWAWVSVLLAFIVYKAAVSKARDWGDAVLQAFVIHRETLRQELGLRQFKNKSDEKQVWEMVSGWLHNPENWPLDIPLEAVLPSPQLQWLCSENAKISLQYATTDEIEPEPEEVNGAEPGVQYVYQYIDYVILVSSIKAEGSSSETNDIYIIVSDPQVPIIASPPPALDWNDQPCTAANAKVIPASPADTQLVSKVIPTAPAYLAHQLLWHVKPLTSNNAIALRYHQPSRILRVTTNKPELKISVLKKSIKPDGVIDYEFSITNSGDETINDAQLEVLETRRALPKDLPGGTFTRKNLVSEEEIPPPKSAGPPVTPIQEKPGVYKWKLPRLVKGQVVVLEYQVIKAR